MQPLMFLTLSFLKRVGLFHQFLQFIILYLTRQSSLFYTLPLYRNEKRLTEQHSMFP